MWQELQKSPAFFLLFDKKQKYYKILITDFIRIWGICYTEDKLIARLKDSNFGLEIEKDELLDKGLQMLHRPSELKNIKISINGLTLTVSMSRSFGFLLKFSVNLEEGSRELFFQKVTQPALRTIQDLRCSQQELRKLLITKDDEIEEYKSFGGKIRYTAIPPYNDEMHMKKHCLYFSNFGDADVPDSVVDKLIDVPPENPKIKEEMIETKESVKLEPVSQKRNAPSTVGTTHTVKKENIKIEVEHAEILSVNSLWIQHWQKAIQSALCDRLRGDDVVLPPFDPEKNENGLMTLQNGRTLFGTCNKHYYSEM